VFSRRLNLAVKLIDWLILLGIVVALLALWQFREFLLLTFLAIVLATALNSLVRQILQRFNLSRVGAVVVVLLLVLVAVGLFVGLIVPPFVEQFGQLVVLIPQGFDNLVLWADNVIDHPPYWFPELDPALLPRFPDLLEQGLSLLRKIFGNFFDFFSGSLSIALQFGLVLILTIMILADPLAYRRLLLRLFPFFYRSRVDEILQACEITLLNWMRGVSISSFFVAVFSGIGLTILGVPFVFAHALLAGVFNFIPNVGPTLSLVFPVSVAMLDSVWKAIAVVILYIVIQTLESYWISPLIMKQQVSLLPAATLVAQIFFATFLGPLGLILALPLAVVAKTWIEEILLKDVLDRLQGTFIYSPAESTGELRCDSTNV
jgi:predicted PurR-regulated permease PerM